MQVCVGGSGRRIDAVAGASFTCSLSLSLSCRKKSTDLQGGVSDEVLRALASAGCGEKLTELCLWGDALCAILFCCCAGVGVLLDLCGLVRLRGCDCRLFPPPSCAFNLAGLQGGGMDGGLRLLASAGCGENLTVLSLSSEFPCMWTPFSVFFTTFLVYSRKQECRKRELCGCPGPSKGVPPR